MLRSNSDCFGLGTELWLTKCHTGKTLLVCGRWTSMPPEKPCMLCLLTTRPCTATACPAVCIRKVTKQSGRIRQMRASGVVSLTPFTTVTGLVLSIRISEKPIPLWPPKSWIPFPQLLPSVGGRCSHIHGMLGSVPWQLCLPNCLSRPLDFGQIAGTTCSLMDPACFSPLRCTVWLPGLLSVPSPSVVLGLPVVPLCLVLPSSLAFAKLHTVLSCLLWLTPFTVLPVRVPLSGFGRTVWVLLPGFINCFGEGLGCRSTDPILISGAGFQHLLTHWDETEYSSARCRRTEFSAVLAPNLRRGNSFTMQWQTKRQGCPIRLVLLIFGGNGKFMHRLLKRPQCCTSRSRTFTSQLGGATSEGATNLTQFLLPPRRTQGALLDPLIWVCGEEKRCRKFRGSMHVKRAIIWLLERLDLSPGAPVEWISFTQLHLDFQMSWGNPGPLRINGQWVDTSSRPYLDAERFPARQRTKWFRQFLKALFKEAKMSVHLEQCKPKSATLQSYLQVIALPWCPRALFEVENWLTTHLREPCVRAASTLKSLPLAAQTSSMRLELAQ